MSSDKPASQIPTHLAATSESRPIHVLVIVVSYRTAALVAESLESLLEERDSASSNGIQISVTVVDNASGDAAEIRAAITRLDAHSWIEVVEAERNGGFAYGNNLAMRLAYERNCVPDYFMLLNPDARVRKNALSELVQFLELNPRVGIAGSSLELGDGSFWPYAFRFPSILSELNSGMSLGLLSTLLKNWVIARKMTDQPEAVDWMPGASMMLRRKLIEDVGGMDEAYFLYYEETDYCRKVWNAGWTIWYVPSSRVMHAPGGSTGVTTPGKTPRRLPSYWYESRRRYFAKNFGLPYAAATDVVFVCANLLGSLKLLVQGRANERVPFLIRDIVRHSILLPRNRRISPADEFKPPSADGAEVVTQS